MRENSIEWITGEDVAGVTLTQQKYKSAVKRYAEKYPDKVQIVAENDDGSMFAHMALEYVRILRPKTGKARTDEEIAEFRQRMADYRNSHRQ